LAGRHRPGADFRENEEHSMDMRLEVVVVPVADVDWAKQFYKGLGWREDIDLVVDENFRAVQMTPPGSPCSIHFGIGGPPGTPGSVAGLYLAVEDIEAARAELVEHGADVSEILHDAEGGLAARGPRDARAGAGPGPPQLRVVRHLRRPGRQRLGAPGTQDASARPVTFPT
jgi:catechol 2,3-dioxygenase-like lactoylglutathione lyase family enzyme